MAVALMAGCAWGGGGGATLLTVTCADVRSSAARWTHLCRQREWTEMFRPLSGFISVASAGSMANLFPGVLALDLSL